MTSLSMYRGDDHEFTVTLTEDGAAMDLTGAVIRFTAKHRITDPDGEAAIAKTTTDGITVSAPLTGVAVVAIDAEDTADLPATAHLVFDIQVTRGGKTKTAASGTLTVAADVSRTSP